MPRRLRLLAAAALLPFLASCVTVTENARALVHEPQGIAVRSLDCDEAARTAAERWSQAAPIDASAIRLLTWNLHKQDDAGWDRDLARFAGDADVLLLQEVTLTEPVMQVLQSADLGWVMASSFIYNERDVGVLTATRVAPVATCTQRMTEPLLRLPKSAVISWLRLPGTADTLAVVNVHAVNFSLTLGAYRDQLRAIGDALTGHRGPIVLGGDMNTWTDERLDAVRELGARLGLAELTYPEHDLRSLFLGKQLDHIFVRGLAVTKVEAIPVTSSDHNPVQAVLRYPP
ncbi:MAG: endonuclease/exonuclease/phosphatase family protein [Burkholderiales bacterium]